MADPAAVAARDKEEDGAREIKADDDNGGEEEAVATRKGSPKGIADAGEARRTAVMGRRRLRLRFILTSIEVEEGGEPTD